MKGLNLLLPLLLVGCATAYNPEGLPAPEKWRRHELRDDILDRLHWGVATRSGSRN